MPPFHRSGSVLMLRRNETRFRHGVTPMNVPASRQESGEHHRSACTIYRALGIAPDHGYDVRSAFYVTEDGKGKRSANCLRELKNP